MYDVEGINVSVDETLHIVKGEAGESGSGCGFGVVGRRYHIVHLRGTRQRFLVLLQLEVDEPGSSILKNILQILGYRQVGVGNVKIDGRPKDDFVGGGEMVIGTLQFSLEIGLGSRHVAWLAIFAIKGVPVPIRGIGHGA